MQQPPEPTEQQVLKRVFGYDTFRPGQHQLVRALLAGQDVLAVVARQLWYIPTADRVTPTRTTISVIRKKW